MLHVRFYAVRAGQSVSLLRPQCLRLRFSCWHGMATASLGRRSREEVARPVKTRLPSRALLGVTAFQRGRAEGHAVAKWPARN